MRSFLQGRVIVKDQEFIFPSVKLDDEGYYTCSAVGENGASLPNLHKGRMTVRDSEYLFVPYLWSSQIIILTFTNFQDSDKGVYVCKRTVSGSSTEESVTVDRIREYLSKVFATSSLVLFQFFTLVVIWRCIKISDLQKHLLPLILFFVLVVIYLFVAFSS